MIFKTPQINIMNPKIILIYKLKINSMKITDFEKEKKSECHWHSWRFRIICHIKLF